MVVFRRFSSRLQNRMFLCFYFFADFVSTNEKKTTLLEFSFFFGERPCNSIEDQVNQNYSFATNKLGWEGCVAHDAHTR
jgi:hypothetical protein